MDLENRFFYRLVKVLQILLIALLVLTTVLFLWTDAPYAIIAPNFPTPKQVAETKIENILSSITATKYVAVTDPVILMDAFSPKTPLPSYTLILLLTFSAFMFFYSFINIFFETLLYLVFGKKLSWQWILFLRGEAKQ